MFYNKIMKRCVLGILFFMCVSISYSQEKEASTVLRVEPSGVVVHKSVGVSNSLNITSVSVQENPVRTIDDYSKEELENMLFYVNLKLEKTKEEGGDDQEVNYYKEQKRLVEDKLKIKEGK